MSKLTRTTKFIPALCKEGPNGEPPKFEGSVTLTIPSMAERYGYLENAKFELDEKGQMMAVVKQLPAAVRSVELTKHHYTEVALKNLTTGEEFSSVESMEYDSECDPILFEVANAIMSGLKPGKN